MKRSLHSFSQRITNCTHRAPPVPQKVYHGCFFHTSTRRQVVKPFVLADIGEGIREVQIIQWFVQPGARVEQFDKICEVASDKAIVEITSRFDGVIKKLHYEPDAMAQVGKPLCDIDIQGDISPADQKLVTPDTDESKSEQSSSTSTNPSEEEHPPEESPPVLQSSGNGSRKSSHLATPAVRALLKEHKLEISTISGTGRDGRVLKEDVHNHLNSQTTPEPTKTASSPLSNKETTTPMTPLQTAMFKSMTRSLSIPHFLYSDEVDLTTLSHLRTTHNKTSSQKISYLPYIIKAVSLSLHKHPNLNATLSSNTPTPSILHRQAHNIGIALDTPAGLMVPVIKNVQSLSIAEIASQIKSFQSLAAEGKLTSHPELLSGGTLTISNIGNIGGGVLSPVLVEGQSVILGIGRARDVPRFVDGSETVVRRRVAVFSWTADHRVLDGATVARFAECVAGLVGEPGGMVLEMR